LSAASRRRATAPDRERPSMPASWKARLRTTLAPTVRELRRRVDNPAVKSARLLVAKFRTDPPDVLHFGASESIFVGRDDVDRRTLPQMVRDSLPDETTFYSVVGPGYHPALFDSYLQLIAGTPQKPVVVIGLAVRLGLMPWSDHPQYGHHRALAAVRKLDPDAPLWRMRKAVRPATDRQMAAHDRRPWESLAGTLTIGEYRIPLKDPASHGLTPAEATRLFYAYHHGSAIEPDGPWLDGVAALGRTLRDLSIKVVPYHIPMPIEEGNRIFGDVFAERVIGNLNRIEEAFARGYGPVEFVPTGTALESADFLDPADAVEHFNERGRAKLTALIAPMVTANLLAVRQEAEAKRHLARSANESIGGLPR
jgi:hypothetical protein